MSARGRLRSSARIALRIVTSFELQPAVVPEFPNVPAVGPVP